MLDVELSRLLLSVVLLLSLSLLFGSLFERIRLPRVVGEVFSGILIGPSLLGNISPRQYEWIFNGFNSQEKLLSLFYYLGLIFLMLSAGFSVPRLDKKKDLEIIVCLFLGGMFLPFTVGFLLADLIPNSMQANSLAFKLTLATAAAVTSIPVLSRIFFDLNLLTHKFAIRVITAAAFQDVILWVVLSLAITLEETGLQEDSLIYAFIKVIVPTFLFIVLVMLGIPRLLRLGSRVSNLNLTESTQYGYSILIALSIITFATLLKINVVLGALLAGIVLNLAGGNKMEQVKKNTVTFSNSFLVPIYFALVGLQINLASFNDWYLLASVLCISSMIKIISVTLFSRIATSSWKTSFDYGFSMNARGGPGIVLASLARGSGIIDDSLFVVLVLVSLLTSTLAGVWLRFRREFI
jgi:Kef-type K+ transport system membrane component KefB